MYWNTRKCLPTFWVQKIKAVHFCTASVCREEQALAYLIYEKCLTELFQ